MPRSRKVKRSGRTLRLKQDDFVTNIDSIKLFDLSVEVEICPDGILDRVDDGGIAFASEDSTGDLVLGGIESLLAIQLVKTKGTICFFWFSLLPDLYALIDDDFLIGWSGRCRIR